ncbi:unnamed protein product [Camellia sinensis]
MPWKCFTPFNHSCNAHADNSIIPNNLVVPSDDRSYFYIKIVAEFSTPSVEDEDGLPTNNPERIEHVRPFLVPYDQLIQNEASWYTISNMLSSVHIPLDTQPNMLHRISRCAHVMARTADSMGRKVLPMIVKIYLENCVYYNEEDEVDVFSQDSMEEMLSRQVPASKASMEDLEPVRAEGSGSTKQCVICQEELPIGCDAKQMPCAHVFHGKCIVRWLEGKI